MTGKVVHVNAGVPNCIYIGRQNRRYGLPASPFSNPFRIGTDGTRDQVIEAFRDWVETSQDPRALWVRYHIGELRGKTLACWCKPQRCHGDVLVELAEAR